MKHPKHYDTSPEVSKRMANVTFPSYGAYYEAGFAQAAKKEVIYCCREEEYLNKERTPHFDIAQRLIIVWKNEEELVEKLKDRIIATVK